MPMGLGLGLGIGSTGTPGGASFDATTQAWDGFFINYAGTTWPGTDSVGDSGNQDLGEDGTSPGHDRPTVGTPLNGHGVATYGGTAKLASVGDLAAFATASAWTMACLAKPASLPVGEASPYNDGCLWVNRDGIWGMSMTSLGARVWQFDGAYKIAIAPTAPRASEWNLLQAYRTATHLFVRLINETDGVGAWSAGDACDADWGGEATTFLNVTGTRNTGGTAFYTGDIAGIWLAKTNLAAGLDDHLSYVRGLSGLALI